MGSVPHYEQFNDAKLPEHALNACLSMCPAVSVVMVNMFETSNKVLCPKAEWPGLGRAALQMDCVYKCGPFCLGVFYLGGRSRRDHFIVELRAVLTPVYFAAVGGIEVTDLAVSHTIWTQYNVQTGSNSALLLNTGPPASKDQYTCAGMLVWDVSHFE